MPPPAMQPVPGRKDASLSSSPNKTLFETYSTLVPWTKGKAASYAALPADEESTGVDSSDEYASTTQSSLHSNRLPKNSSADADSSTSDAEVSMSSEPVGIWQSVLAWTCMALAILAGASIGPAFRYMMEQGITPLLAASWRNQTMVLTLLPLAIWEARRSGGKVDWWKKKPGLQFPVIVHVLISGLAWAANLLFWIVGLQYISTFKASVIASSHPVLLVVAMRLSGQHVSLLEAAGVAVAFLGMFMSEYRGDSAEPQADGRDEHLRLSSMFLHAHASSSAAALPTEPHVPFHLQLFGLFLCLLAAGGEVVVIMNRIQTRPYVPLFQYTTSTCLVVTITATLLAVVLEDAVCPLQTDGCFSERGLLGWAAPAWRLRMLLFGLWVGTVCISGFNYAMQYIPPLVFSALSLVDPAVTAGLSYWAGLEALPSLFSWLGGGVVLAGVALISYGERVREKTGDGETSDGGGDYRQVSRDEETGESRLVDETETSDGEAGQLMTSSGSQRGEVEMRKLAHHTSVESAADSDYSSLPAVISSTNSQQAAEHESEQGEAEEPSYNDQDLGEEEDDLL
eukprot:gene31212-37721_t